MHLDIIPARKIEDLGNSCLHSKFKEILFLKIRVKNVRATIIFCLRVPQFTNILKAMFPAHINNISNITCGKVWER
jgi:hypothetical protein